VHNFPNVVDVVHFAQAWLIGGEREGQHNTMLARMAQCPNVHLLGHRPYAKLRGYNKVGARLRSWHRAAQLPYLFARHARRPFANTGERLHPQDIPHEVL
jgi:hypothetical protein